MVSASPLPGLQFGKQPFFLWRGRLIPVSPLLGETIRQRMFEAVWCSHTTSDRRHTHNRYDFNRTALFYALPAPGGLDRRPTPLPMPAGRRPSS